jgi:hypothetical protein
MKMRQHGPDIVAVWGGISAMTLFIHLIYGGNAFPLALQGSVVFLIELIAAVAWLAQYWYGAEAHESPGPRRSRAPLMLGGIAGFVGAGLVYKAYMMAPALLLVVPLYLELSSPLRAAHNARRAAGAPILEEREEGAHHGALAKAAVVGGAALGVAAWRRHRRLRAQTEHEAHLPDDERSASSRSA